MRYFIVVAAILAAMAVGTPPAQAAGPSNPCALLTLSEAQSITGLSLTSSDPNPMRADNGADKDTACTYDNDKSQMVSVMVHDDSAFFPGNAKNQKPKASNA